MREENNFEKWDGGDSEECSHASDGSDAGNGGDAGYCGDDGGE